MTDAPKRYSTPCGHGLEEHPHGLAYHKDEVDAYIADLSDALVRAGMLSAATLFTGQDWVSESNREAIEQLTDNSEAVAAIVAQVMQSE